MRKRARAKRAREVVSIIAAGGVLLSLRSGLLSFASRPFSPVCEPLANSLPLILVTIYDVDDLVRDRLCCDGTRVLTASFPQVFDLALKCFRS